MFKIFQNKDSWKKQKWPARVGYYKIGDGDWYEVWNDGSYPPTPWTRVKLFKRKIFKPPTFRKSRKFLVMVTRLPIISMWYQR